MKRNPLRPPCSGSLFCERRKLRLAIDEFSRALDEAVRDSWVMRLLRWALTPKKGG